MPLFTPINSTPFLKLENLFYPGWKDNRRTFYFELGYSSQKSCLSSLKQLERYSLNQRNNFVELDLIIGVKIVILNN